MGTLLQDRLKNIAQNSDMLSDVRGLGLMVGVEIAGYGTLSPAECADRILECMKDMGYLLGKTGPGRNVLTWMPPLIIQEEELMEAADALEKTLQTL